MKEFALLFSFLFSTSIFSKNNIHEYDMLMDTSELDISLCEGESIEINGVIYSQMGMDTIILPGASYDGTDSVIVLSIDVLENDTTELFFEYCSGDINPMTGEDVTHYGSYEDDYIIIVDEIQLIGHLGCDSIVIGESTVYPEFWLIGEGHVPYGYVVNGVPLYETTSIETYDTTAYGCPDRTSYTYIVGPNSITELEKEINLKIFPNPIISNLTLEFEMPKTADLNIVLHNALGQKIEQLFSENKFLVGKQNLNFPVEHLPPGIYFLHLEIEGEGLMKKLVKY